MVVFDKFTYYYELSFKLTTHHLFAYVTIEAVQAFIPRHSSYGS
jgi:hypothetical protein